MTGDLQGLAKGIPDDNAVYQSLSQKDCILRGVCGIGRCHFLGNTEVNDGKRSLGACESGASLPPSTYFACSRGHIIVFRRHGMRRLYGTLVRSCSVRRLLGKSGEKSLQALYGDTVAGSYQVGPGITMTAFTYRQTSLRAQDLRTGNGRAVYGRLRSCRAFAAQRVSFADDDSLPWLLPRGKRLSKANHYFDFDSGSE